MSNKRKSIIPEYILYYLVDFLARATNDYNITKPIPQKNVTLQVFISHSLEIKPEDVSLEETISHSLEIVSQSDDKDIIIAQQKEQIESLTESLNNLEQNLKNTIIKLKKASDELIKSEKKAAQFNKKYIVATEIMKHQSKILSLNYNTLYGNLETAYNS